MIGRTTRPKQRLSPPPAWRLRIRKSLPSRPRCLQVFTPQSLPGSERDRCRNGGSVSRTIVLSYHLSGNPAPLLERAAGRREKLAAQAPGACAVFFAGVGEGPECGRVLLLSPGSEQRRVANSIAGASAILPLEDRNYLSFRWVLSRPPARSSSEESKASAHPS